MHESSLQRQIMAVFRDTGGKAIKVMAGASGNINEPDLLACVAGVTYACEVKMPGKRPRGGQLARLREWHKAGAVAFVAESEQHARDALSGERERLLYYGGRRER